jgi:hypothetical protein
MEKIVISPSREIHVQISTFRGRGNLDVRTYVITPNYKGYTPKGVNIPLEKARELAQAIIKVLEGEKIGNKNKTQTQ